LRQAVTVTTTEPWPGAACPALLRTTVTFRLLDEPPPPVHRGAPPPPP
jgi:hypothetical protein